MYPPPQAMGTVAPMHHAPYTSSPQQMVTAENQQSVQMQHQQLGMATYTSPAPVPPMVMPQVPTQAAMQYMPPTPPPQGQIYTSPAPTPQIQYTPPPLTAMTPPAAEEGGSMTAMVMPMPETDRDGPNQISVGTRSGPMVLFATAPGASETTIQVQGMSGYPDSVSQQ